MFKRVMSVLVTLCVAVPALAHVPKLPDYGTEAILLSTMRCDSNSTIIDTWIKNDLTSIMIISMTRSGTTMYEVNQRVADTDSPLSARTTYMFVTNLDRSEELITANEFRRIFRQKGPNAFNMYFVGDTNNDCIGYDISPYPKE